MSILDTNLLSEVTLRANCDPELRGDFRTVIQGSLAYGIFPTNLADAFTVSTGAYSLQFGTNAA